jgi:catechol-2,3-dioxygenase
MKLVVATLFCMSLSLPAADGPARLHIVGVSHMALYVHDLAKARAFYKDFLGFDEPYSLTNKDG